MQSRYGQFCPVAKASEVFATRWTPLVLRELMAGMHTFNDIHRGVPLISRAVLVKRLRELEHQGIIERRQRATVGIDQVEIRKLNAPSGKAKFGPADARGVRTYSTSCFVKEALDKGAQLFKWDERMARSGRRVGTTVRGSGVAISAYNAGSVGFDGLFVIKPDGRMYIQTGIGNLGTESWSDCQRVSAEMMGMPWEKVEIAWGDTSKNLPWSCVSGGSQTTHAMTRAAHAAASRS